MKSMRRAAAIAVAIGLSATSHSTAQAASSQTIERPVRSSAVVPAATAAAEEPEPILAAADLKMGLYATHPLASKAGVVYPPGTQGQKYCHPGKWPGQLSDAYTDADGDGFCPLGQAPLDIEVTSDGRLITGYGDQNANVDTDGPAGGRVAVVPLNLQNGQWETPFMANSEQMMVIRKLNNGDLAIPMNDPSKWTTTSGYLTNKGGKWHTVTSSTLFHHIEDLAETASGDIWLFGSFGPAGIITRTTNGGSTWSLMKKTERSGTTVRYTQGSAIGSKVYAVENNNYGASIAFDGTSWSDGGPDWRCEYFQKVCVTPSGFRVDFFDGKTTTTSIRPRVLYSGTPGAFRNGYDVYAASDGYLYSSFGSSVLRTKTVGGPWEAVGQFHSSSENISPHFAVYGDRLYFGGAGGRIYRSGVTVTQAVQASKDAQAAAVKEQERLLAPLKAEMAAADAEVTTAIQVDTAEDTANRAAYVKEQDGFIAERKGRVKALAASSAPAPWATLLGEYAATDAAVSTRRASNLDADRARDSFWNNREDGHRQKAAARSARMDELIKAIPAPYDVKAKELKKANHEDRWTRLAKAEIDRYKGWSAETSRVDGELRDIRDANTAASKAAAKVQPSVAREEKHRSDNSAAEAKRTVGLQGSLFSSYAKFMDSQNKAALGLAKAKPTPSVAGMKADSDRMSRVVKSEAAKAASLLASEAARADRVTVNERARANVDWAATAAAALPGTTELLTTHREILVKRATADRAEQKAAIEADAAARKAAVATYGAVRKQWWAEQGRSVAVTNSLFAAWVRHNASQEAVIARVRKEEEAAAAKLKAGPPLSSEAKAAVRKKLQERVDRLKAESRKLNIDDFAIADRYYASEKKRSAAVYKWDAGMASKVGADQSAWTARAAGAQKARDARLYALNQQWKARISTDRYARDAACNALMQLAPQ